MNGRGTYDHHLKTYGADFTYDDFIPMFMGEKFNLTPATGSTYLPMRGQGTLSLQPSTTTGTPSLTQRRRPTALVSCSGPSATLRAS
jgi:hypothetical protein